MTYCTRVTDFRLAYIELTRTEWAQLPAPVKDYLQRIGTEHTQGWGKPVLIEIPIYRIPELEQVCKDAGMDCAGREEEEEDNA